MSNHPKQIRPLIAVFLLFTLLLAACGTATGEQSPASIVGNPDDSAAAISDDGPQQNESDGEENISAPDAADTESAAPDESSVTVDSQGIEVGFTEDGRPYRGDLNAPIRIEEYSDYQCPYCARFTNQTKPALDENQIADGEAVLVFYDFPLTSIHPQAMSAHHAARCAGEQGAAAYWQMHDTLFATGDEWHNNNADAVFADYAADLGLDVAQFTECQESDKYVEEIQADIALGQSRGVSSTPSFRLNGNLLVGAQPIGNFNDAIASLLGGEEIAAAEPAQPPQPGVAPTPAAVSDENIGVALGDPDAPVTIVEYTDYQCPFCGRHVQQTMPLIQSELIDTGRIRYIIKDFPLDNIHAEARIAAAAAHCAGEQEAYMPMHDLLFETQAEWSGQGETAVAFFTDLADQLSLDVDAFSQCLNSGRYEAVVQANLEEGLSLGVTGTPAFFIDGYPVSGAQPFDLFQFAVDLAEEGTLGEAYVREEPEPTPAPSGPVDIPLDGAYSLGDPNAPVTIIEYTDYQCPFCGRHVSQTFPQIKENFIDEGLVRYIFKDFPLTSIHPQAVAAAQAARCAGDQQAYIEMHDRLFARQDEWSGRNDAADLFTGYAADLGLDADAFSQCLSSGQYEEAVMANLSEGANFGVTGTPAFFLNGYYLSGAQPYSTFEEAITSLLQEAQ